MNRMGQLVLGSLQQGASLEQYVRGVESAHHAATDRLD